MKDTEALLLGWLAGTLTKGDNIPLRVKSVDVPVEDGNYQPYIEVTLMSGAKIHVLITSFEPGEHSGS